VEILDHRDLSQADEILVKLAQAIQMGSASGVQQQAHKLSGASAVCGMTAMIAPAEELERLGAANELTDASRVFYQALEALLRIRRYLAASIH
jgi:HPt (histidine-containing phosphotransfer) domain-containing protein